MFHMWIYSLLKEINYDSYAFGYGILCILLGVGIGWGIRKVIALVLIVYGLFNIITTLATAVEKIAVSI